MAVRRCRQHYAPGAQVGPGDCPRRDAPPRRGPQVVGRYNWTLGALTAPNHTPYTSGYPVRKVLALHPSIDLSRTRSWAEYNSIVLGLLQVREVCFRRRRRRLCLAFMTRCHRVRQMSSQDWRRRWGSRA